jgi:hypothetical protein
LLVVKGEMVPVDANGKMQQGEEGEERGDEEHGLERMAACAGFREAAELGDEAGAKKEQEDREAPEDGEKIEAVAGARVGDGFLVFLGREVVGGGGILGGCGGRRSGGILNRRRRNQRRRRVSTIGGRTNWNREKQEEKAGLQASGRGGAHEESIKVGWYTRARA